MESPAARLQETLRRVSDLRRSGQLEEALALFEEVLRTAPPSFEALYPAAVIAAQLGITHVALGLLDESIEIDPDNAAAHCNRGVVLQSLERLDAALASFDTAVAIKADYALAHKNRGNALDAVGRWDAALESYDRAIEIDSDFAEACCGRGNVLQKLGRPAAALASYDRAIHINPCLAEAHSNRGIALTAVGRLSDALASFDRAILIRPDYAQAHVGRGNAFKELNRLDDALVDYNRAIALRAHYSEAHFSRAITLLLRGDLAQGWIDYEWRARKPGFSQPLWQGAESLAAKSLLVHCEKGLGDTLQFCRYVKLLSERGARVILQVQAPLRDLLATLEGASRVVAEGDALPEVDYQCPLLSLPLAFKTVLDTIPASRKYLSADARLVAQWRAKLGEPGKPRIGLVWRGDPNNRDDRNRSISFNEVLKHLPARFEYFTLQKRLTESESSMMRAFPRLSLSVDELDFAQTAALAECLDLLISVDTSVAHLGAALGKNTWVMLPFSPDCRWLLNRNDSPWYPTVKLYRQDTLGDWARVLARVAADLQQEFIGE
jgi:tetratricopeptide (TPR) repeat protein